MLQWDHPPSSKFTPAILTTSLVASLSTPYYLQPMLVLAAVTMSKEVLALAATRDNTDEGIGTSKVPWPACKMSAELSVETTGKVAEDFAKSASNFPATAGSMKNLLDLYWPVPSVTGDLHVKTTRAKRKVDDKSNFLATAGSFTDVYITRQPGTAGGTELPTFFQLYRVLGLFVGRVGTY